MKVRCLFHTLAAHITMRKAMTLLAAVCEIIFAAAFLTSSKAGYMQPVLGWSAVGRNSEQAVKAENEGAPGARITVSVGTTPAPQPSPDLTPVLTPDPTPKLTPVPTSTPMPAPIQPAQTVENPPLRYPVNSIKTSESVVYLTMDDGYDGNSITRALDTLRQKGVKCTFFIIGDALKTHPALWRKAVEDGHQICNHTATHRYLSQLPEEEMRKEIAGWEQAVTSVLGKDYLEKMKKEFPYFRLPGGMGSNEKRILQILAEQGYVPVGWSIETVYDVLRLHNLKTEPAEPIASQVTTHVTSSVKQGSIVLLHFNPYDTLTLGNTIQGIKDRGYELKTIQEAFHPKEPV